MASFSTVLSRGSTFSHKRSAPSSFSASFSLQSQSKPANDSLMLPLECAFFLPCIDHISIDKYFIAVGNLLGGDFQKIIYGGRNGSRIVMHLSSQSLLNDFAAKNESITIDEHILPIRKLIDPGLILYLHNVAPHIPNDLLVDELKKSVRLMSDIKLTNYGMRDYRLRHILAYKRQVQIRTEDREKVPTCISVTCNNVPHTIYLSFDTPRCFSCGKEGHVSKNCPESTQTPAQQRLEDIKLAAPSSHDENISPPSFHLPPPPPPAPPSDFRDENTEVLTGRESVKSPSADFESSRPNSPLHDFFPKFSSSLSSSLESLDESIPGDSVEMSTPADIPAEITTVADISSVKSTAADNVSLNSPEKSLIDDFPVLPALKSLECNVKNNKRTLPSSESQNEKKIKTSTLPDPELSEGFKSLVSKIIIDTKETSVTADDVCNLLAKLRNSQKKQEIINQSKLPLVNLKNILQNIHSSPDASHNMKARITRLLKNVFDEKKMFLKNVENISS